MKTENTTAAAMPYFTMDDLPLKEQTRIRLVESACRLLDKCSAQFRGQFNYRVADRLNDCLAEANEHWGYDYRRVTSHQLMLWFYSWRECGRNPLSLVDMRVLTRRRPAPVA